MVQMHQGFPIQLTTDAAKGLKGLHFKWEESCWKWFGRQKKSSQLSSSHIKILQVKAQTQDRSHWRDTGCGVQNSEFQCTAGEKSLNLPGLGSSHPTTSALLEAFSYSRFFLELVQSCGGPTGAGSVFQIFTCFCHSEFRGSPSLKDSPWCGKGGSKP